MKVLTWSNFFGKWVNNLFSQPASFLQAHKSYDKRLGLRGSPIIWSLDSRWFRNLLLQQSQSHNDGIPKCFCLMAKSSAGLLFEGERPLWLIRQEIPKLIGGQWNYSLNTSGGNVKQRQVYRCRLHVRTAFQHLLHDLSGVRLLGSDSEWRGEAPSNKDSASRRLMWISTSISTSLRKTWQTWQM